MQLKLQDTFNQELPADPETSNTRRQVFDSCFSYVAPRTPSSPKLIHVAPEMLEAIGLSEKDMDSEEFLAVFSGGKVLDQSRPYAMCYGGHQFGNWAGQLGDGRAINLTEVVHKGNRWALQLKGAGETPYSRGADGLAVLRSSVREHLCSEAMHHLGVPTTRSLSLVLTGDQVLRDVMYDGNPAYEKGAVVCRVAPSFIRFGNFQIFASRGDTKTLQKLTDYTIEHFFPTAKAGTKEGYVEFFRLVAERTLEMVVHWQRVGFVHGVMNTDNMSILGLTIDYGPYGWLEGYEPGWTPNTTDAQMKRYRFGQQPRIVLWNLLQLANSIYPLIEDAPPLQEILDQFYEKYEQAYLKMMLQKLGLQESGEAQHQLIHQLEDHLQMTETDMTIFFRRLGDFSMNVDVHGSDPVQELLAPALYQTRPLDQEILDTWKNWFADYQTLLKAENSNDAKRRIKMNQVNPKYVLRNYMAQLAIDAANDGDYSLVKELYQMLKQPYAEQPEMEKWFIKRPEWARHKVGCSMLSCSS